MRKGMILLFGVLLSAASVNFSGVFAQEEIESLYSELSGEVVEVGDSSLRIQYQVPEPGVRYEGGGEIEAVTFTVTQATEIIKGFDSVELSSLKAGEKVSVEYTTDVDGRKVAEGIFVEDAM